MTHPKKRTKVRKPKTTQFPRVHLERSDIYSGIYINGWYTNLDDLRGIHKWLGSAIAYLESKKE